jgi:hypothetical protein
MLAERVQMARYSRQCALKPDREKRIEETFIKLK